MAHANIFQKINKANTADVKTDDGLADAELETIQLLAQQVISLREMIDDQHTVIEELAGTISKLKLKQKEMDQNLKLTHIDQKDLAKQLRTVKSKQDVKSFVRQKEQSQGIRVNQNASRQETIPEDKDIEELFFNNAKNSTVMKNSQASDAIKRTLEELKKLEKPKQKFLAKKQAQAVQGREIRNKEQEPRTRQNMGRSLSNEELSKQIIFGKTSRFLP